MGLILKNWNNCEQENTENLEKVKEIIHVEWDEKTKSFRDWTPDMGKNCELDSLGNGKPMYNLRVRIEMPEPQKVSFEQWQ